MPSYCVKHTLHIIRSFYKKIGTIKLTQRKQKYFVTRPTLPKLEDYQKYLEQIWETGIVTNRGPVLLEYEQKLATHLKVDETIVTANATLALMVLMRSMGLKGEVITTPFTFAATASSIFWSGLTPVFVDIEPDGVNISPDAVKAAITPNTSAILAVHCYGIPCDHEALQRIAEEHDLKLIYDACHAFGTEIDGASILELGDASVLSLHATKLVSSAEGGLIVISDRELVKRVRLNINFGIANENEIPEIGINAKMSELHAALGLCNLELLPSIYHERKKIYETYRQKLKNINELKILARPFLTRDGFSYIPTLISDDSPHSVQSLKMALADQGIYTRRYFHPLLTETPAFASYAPSGSGTIQHAANISSRVLCLPIYHGLSQADVKFICDQISQFFNDR